MQQTQEHRAIRQTVRKFVEQELNPHIDAWEAAEIFPAREVFQKLGGLGLLGITKPTEFGGLGLDASFSVAFAEELGHCTCGALPMAIGVVTDMATPALARFGSDELRREFLAPTLTGERVCSIAVSEPGAGSDVASVTTTARRDGDDYVIDGSKMWITNGMQADWVCLLANTGDGPAHANKSLILVPMDRPGITRSKIRKLGMWASDTAQLFFDGVRVPARFRIGDEGRGFAMQMQQFQEERLFVSASTLVTFDRLIAQTAEYTRQRKAFGQSILDNQSVHFRLAELQTEVEALRALIYRTVGLYIENKDDPEVVKLASMCKLKSGRLARELVDGCLQYWGGMGFTWDNPVARAYRDLRLGSIGGGADEVMLGIISKAMGTLPRKARG
ncbi:acyl-CoA dehydrogenase family protein [Corallococcus sp. AS-1-6]|uniref:acyl-CoA dehydrogenase family protein n=1 Tax=Corallococcus sp. AS-1-6 TaxID=2874599 RepID=UPI001CBCC9D3|nr:acyl-CoA dehydrogenase family protein [Corallococcus sp. AS-1-6]MBZ4377237.1 acyl-CoA dehydrogenase family protein [Corallococcus sp. AS-1-6]